MPLHVMDRAAYERILRGAQAAHCAMLRWWGGGVPERPAFYELCDCLGLMLLHDFFPANSVHHASAFDIKFTSEGGASTVANLSTLEKIIPAEELRAFDDERLSPAWLCHNARPGG
jgi:beta-galactosidase/beta-glucuronidase